MARIIGIDYGTKRVGLSVTDPLQIIATGLTTVPTKEIFTFLQNYINTEDVEGIVVGNPLHMDGNPAQISGQVHKFVGKLQKLYPTLTFHFQDERFTSVDAKRIILESGAKKKKRRDKGLVDKVSAVLILQDFMERKRNLNILE